MWVPTEVTFLDFSSEQTLINLAVGVETQELNSQVEIKCQTVLLF